MLRWNPLTWLLELFRAPIFEGRTPTATEFAVGLGLGVGTLGLGWLVFHRFEDRFINYV